MKKSLFIVFGLLVVNFITIIYAMLTHHPKVVLIGMLPFFLLGISLIFLTFKHKLKGLLKKFLLLTGISSSGFFISGVLHNLIYAMFKNFFDKTSVGDEVFFFAVAVFICPLAFLIGAIGSILFFIKGNKANK
jgi:hypothetical protein